MGVVPDGRAVLAVYDSLDQSDQVAVERFNALSFAYLCRDDVEAYEPGRVVVRVRAHSEAPVQLTVLDEWSSSVGDPHARKRVWLKARARGEL